MKNRFNQKHFHYGYTKNNKSKFLDNFSINKLLSNLFQTNFYTNNISFKLNNKGRIQIENIFYFKYKNISNLLQNAFSNENIFKDTFSNNMKTDKYNYISSIIIKENIIGSKLFNLLININTRFNKNFTNIIFINENVTKTKTLDYILLSEKSNRDSGNFDIIIDKSTKKKNTKIKVPPDPKNFRICEKDKKNPNKQLSQTRRNSNSSDERASVIQRRNLATYCSFRGIERPKQFKRPISESFDKRVSWIQGNPLQYPQENEFPNLFSQKNDDTSSICSRRTSLLSTEFKYPLTTDIKGMRSQKMSDYQKQFYLYKNKTSSNTQSKFIPKQKPIIPPKPFLKPKPIIAPKPKISNINISYDNSNTGVNAHGRKINSQIDPQTIYSSQNLYQSGILKINEANSEKCPLYPSKKVLGPVMVNGKLVTKPCSFTSFKPESRFQTTNSENLVIQEVSRAEIKLPPQYAYEITLLENKTSNQSQNDLSINNSLSQSKINSGKVQKSKESNKLSNLKGLLPNSLIKNKSVVSVGNTQIKRSKSHRLSEKPKIKPKPSNTLTRSNPSLNTQHMPYYDGSINYK